MTVLSTKSNSKQLEVQESWTSGPSILTSFFTKNNSITRIVLAQAKGFSCRIIGNNLENEIFEWMERYSKREKGRNLPLDLSMMTPFTKKGLLAIKRIPFGGVASYGEIASLAGQEKGARAIGNVCNKNPYPLVIPCHRVIQGNGAIGGFAYPIEMKQLLLDFES
ncbi:MAG: MGMT family protein [Simkaniaceae bacterium]|nr:MAG: MGMT family protein [Simkaniaceae bacterium]